MKKFTLFLKSINERLSLPQPLKSQILLEVAGDLEDVYEFYINKGLNEQEAMQKAEEKLDLTDDTLSELIRVHQSVYGKLMNRISEQAQTRWERIFLILTILFVGVLSGRQILSTQFFLQASSFIWPVLGIGCIVIVLSIVKFYNLYIKKDHNIKNLRTGLSSFLFLGGASLFTGIVGYYIELYSAGGLGALLEAKLILIVRVTTGLDETSRYIGDWMIKSSSMIMTSMLVTILAALIWFILINKVIKIEQSEAEFLLEE